MIDMPLLLAFFGAASILTVTPGVDTAMVLRSVAASGRRSAALAAIGIALGCMIWGVAVSIGLGALLQTSELAYATIKWAGAGYLLWLGIKLILKPRTDMDIDERKGQSPAGSDAFWKGFLTNLLNPKVGVFYITFLPHFVPDKANVASYTLFLAFLHVLLTLTWFCALIAATIPLSKFLRRPESVRMLDRFTGILFVAFSVRLATSSAR